LQTGRGDGKYWTEWLLAFLEKDWEVLGIIQDVNFLQTPHSLGCGDNGKNCEFIRIIHCTEL
jgi:hypothetical protein